MCRGQPGERAKVSDRISGLDLAQTSARFNIFATEYNECNLLNNTVPADKLLVLLPPQFSCLCYVFIFLILARLLC